MYQILIVDDESIEREVVRFLFKEYKFPLEISEAANGKEALELLSRQRFDILFTDIRMPFLDGFELASKALELYPDIQIIFFSGYDEFSYVKKALSLHVVNYILKPVDSDELKATITNVLNQIREKEESSKKQKATLDFSQNHILYQLVNRTHIKQLETLYPALDLSFLYRCCRLLLIQLEHDYFQRESAEAAGSSFSLDLQHLLPPDSYYINLNPSQDLIIFTGQDHLLSWYQNLCTKITDHIQKQYLIRCHLALSELISHPDELADAYEEAETQVMEHIFFKNTSAPSALSESSQSDDDILEQLRLDIKFKDSQNLQRHMANLLQLYKSKKNLSHIYFRFLSTNVLTLLLEGLSLNTDESVDEYAKIVYRSSHISEIEALLLRLTEQLAARLDEERDSPKYALQMVKQYIHTHYNEYLSLDILAEKVYLSPRYLSALFISENDCGINKYIKKVRMEKAQDLLLHTNLKVNDICLKVGYSNLSYFCKSFAEEFGTTPDKFRNQK